MNWTPATSIGSHAAHPSKMRVLTEHRDSTDPSQFHEEGSDLIGEDSSRGSLRPFSCRSTPPGPFFSAFAHPLRADREDAGSHSRKRECAYSAQFLCNLNPLDATLPSSLLCVMCCKQRTCAIRKPRRCNTYKKQGAHPSSQIFFSFLLSHLPYILPSSVSRKSFACHSYENTGGVGVFFPFWNSSHAARWAPSILTSLLRYLLTSLILAGGVN